METEKLLLSAILQATNVCELLDEDQCESIGRTVLDGYNADKQSRSEWEERQAFANKLALQVKEEKGWPWPRCSNVKFPLITVAALQYQARAYPALINASELVKTRIFGQDPGGQKAQIGDRISEHMTWQNTEQDEGWEEEHDKLLLVQAIAGTVLIKKLFDPVLKRQTSKLVLPNDFVINYYTKDLATAQRYTHTFYLTKNDIAQRQMDGRYCKDEDDKEIQPDARNKSQDEVVVAKDERQGISPPQTDGVTPYFTGEQYCWLDLDDDGYEEPYIVTFDINSGEVRRIVARFLPNSIKANDGKWSEGKPVYEITPVKFFTKYGFIPSPDGGWYDLGLGSLIGPINETVNSIINQVLDAATMKALGGGFVGRGFKSKSGPFTFQPQQWFPVDAPGDDLRKNILPLPVSDPSPVLFQLLEMLIGYAERIVSATDLQMGENVGQNTPAATARTMDQNGSRVYNAIYKRTWRAMRDEFRLQFQFNTLFLDLEADYPTLVQSQMVSIDDYRHAGINVRPAADPHIVGDNERKEQAQMILSNAMQMPGHNRYQAMLRFYKAYQVSDIEGFMPPPQTQGPNGQPVPAPDFPAPPDPKMLEIQIKQQAQQLDQQKFQSSLMQWKMDLQREIMETQAHVTQMQSQATLFQAQAKSEEMEPTIKLIFAQIEAEGARSDRMLKMIDAIDGSMQGTAGRLLEHFHQNADRLVNSAHQNADRRVDLAKERMRANSQTGGTGMGGVETAPPDQGILPPAGSNGAGLPGLMA